MSRVAFIFRTDVHLTDKTPASWKGDYPAEIWSNLEQIGALANEHKVDAVLDGGDYFHIKTPSKNPHALNIRTGLIHGQYGCPVYCVEGNHDITYNNLDSIEKQPLGVLYVFNAFRRLREEVFQDEGFQVRVVGVPYSLKRTVDELRAVQKQPGDDFLVAVVHALAGEAPPPNVEGFFKEPVFKYADLITPDGPDVWAFGHWHQDQGVSHIGGKHFVNQGAVSRGALIHENIKRTPQVALLEFKPEGINIETFPLDVLPPEEVFDFEKKERMEGESRSIEGFIERLQEDASFDPTATIEDNVKSLDFAAEVREMALVYLKRARGED